MAFKKGRGAPRLRARRAKAKKIMGKKRKFTGAMQGLTQLKKQVKRLTKTIETKSGSQQITDGTEYQHKICTVK